MWLRYNLTIEIKSTVFNGLHDLKIKESVILMKNSLKLESHVLATLDIFN